MSHFATRAEANRANAQSSSGPRTDSGKAASSTNATKHGFYGSLQRCSPLDSEPYQRHLTALTSGFQPANSVEALLIQDLAMLKARLERLEAAEYAILLRSMEDPSRMNDELALAEALVSAAPLLAPFEKSERFLRRNYMQTWSRLERMQRERKLQEKAEVSAKAEASARTEQQTPAGSALKRSQPLPIPSKPEPSATQPEPLPAPPVAPAPFLESAA